MEIYTTDVVPNATTQPVSAWLVWSSSPNDLDEALSRLRAKARERGADAVVGLRVTTGQGGSPKQGGTWTVYYAYGTGVKQSGVGVRQVFS